MNSRLTIVKTILWAVMGSLAVITVARFARGLGAATALSDATPWGFWIAFDVMAGVALAAGGFVLAARVMNARGLWNHDALFDYQDRFMATEPPGWQRSWSSFAEDMVFLLSGAAKCLWPPIRRNTGGWRTCFNAF